MFRTGEQAGEARGLGKHLAEALQRFRAIQRIHAHPLPRRHRTSDLAYRQARRAGSRIRVPSGVWTTTTNDSAASCCGAGNASTPRCWGAGEPLRPAAQAHGRVMVGGYRRDRCQREPTPPVHPPRRSKFASSYTPWRRRGGPADAAGAHPAQRPAARWGVCARPKRDRFPAPVTLAHLRRAICGLCNWRSGAPIRSSSWPC